MPATKIQDRAEAIRWIEEGRTYAWIVEEYKRKYNIDTVQSTWAMFRRREGIPRRIVRDEELMPWAVKKEHRWRSAAMMLRAEGRRRAGVQLTPENEHELDTWLATLKSENAVVAYFPDKPQGFYYVPREPTDKDIVRMPPRGQGLGRKNAED